RASARHVLACCLCFVSVCYLDWPRNVRRMERRRALDCRFSRGPAIGAYPAFLCLYRTRTLLTCPRRDDRFKRIRSPDARDDCRQQNCTAGAHMNKISRRRFLTTGLAASAGVSGLAVAAGLAKRYGLVPPDSGGIYGPGEALTYAAH